jgi:hypothetical protein
MILEGGFYSSPTVESEVERLLAKLRDPLASESLLPVP